MTYTEPGDVVTPVSKREREGKAPATNPEKRRRIEEEVVDVKVESEAVESAGDVTIDSDVTLPMTGRDVSFGGSCADSSFGEVFANMGGGEEEGEDHVTVMSPVAMRDDDVEIMSPVVRESSIVDVSVGIGEEEQEEEAEEVGKELAVEAPTEAPSAARAVCVAPPSPLSAPVSVCASTLAAHTLAIFPAATPGVYSSYLFGLIEHVSTVSLDKLRPLFSSFVSAEAVAVGDALSSTRHGRLRFAAYDFSCVDMPVDVLTDSLTSCEEVVHGVGGVVEEFNGLRTAAGKGIKEGINSVVRILQFIVGEQGIQYRETVATCVGADSTEKQVRQAGLFLLKEFEVAQLVMEEGEGEFAENYMRPSPLRLRLGELIGACVRYHLRALFNPVPPSYTTPSKKHPMPDNSACRSTIHELVCMQVRATRICEQTGRRTQV